MCEGLHKARDCPNRNKLSAITREEDDESDRDTFKLGFIILNLIKVKKFDKRKGLMFTDIMVRGTKITVLVDIRASDLFVAERTTKRLGLKVSKGKGWIKTVNSKEMSTMGVAQGIELQLGEWKNNETIKVILLDDYDFVVGLDFLDRINTLLVPFANCLCILDTRCQCTVLVR